MKFSFKIENILIKKLMNNDFCNNTTLTNFLLQCQLSKLYLRSLFLIGDDLQKKSKHKKCYNHLTYISCNVNKFANEKTQVSNIQIARTMFHFVFGYIVFNTR